MFSPCVLFDASGRAVRCSGVAYGDVGICLSLADLFFKCDDVVVEFAKVLDVDVIRYNLVASIFIPICVPESQVS